MNIKKLQHISLALTLSLLALAGVLALLGAGNSGLPVVQAAALPSVPAAHLAFNDGGWTHSGTQDEWEWGVPSYNGGNGEPLQCAPGSIEGCWVTDLNNTYNANSNQDLTSVVITLPMTATTPISVTWYQAWYIESVTYDHAKSEYRCNDGAWTQMWAHSGGTTFNNWQQAPGGPYGITCVPTDTLQLRFRLSSDGSGQYAGYYVDDMRVFDAAGHDLYVEEFEPPPAPELHITKQADPRSGGLGGIVTYTLAVSNTGNLAAAGALLTDTLDAYQRPQSAASSLGSCTIADSGWGGVVTCTLGDLGIGATAHVTLTAQVTDTVPPQLQITNTAEVAGGGDSASTQISLWPDLQITKHADPRSGGLGGVVTYTLAVSNTGNLAAAGAILTDTLDAYQRPQSAASSLGSCTIADSGWGGVVTCTLGDLGIGATAHITLTAQVTDTVPPTHQITNTAEVVGGGESASTQISLWPDLQITKQANRQTVGPGGTITYTLHINNDGSLTAASTILTDTLDAYQQPQSVATNRGSCAIADPNWGGVITCTLGDLGIGESTHITLTAQVTSTEPVQGFQQITNTADVSGGGDSDSAQTALWLQTCRVRLVEGMDVTPYDTIQEAIDAASGVDSEVQVSGVCVDINQYGGHDQMVYISKTLTLRGGYNADFSIQDTGVYTTTLDAQDNGRVIYITGSGITVTVEGLDITQGYIDDNGGGVYIAQASVTISDCLIRENGYDAWEVYSSNGGGVYIYAGATVRLENNTFFQNWAIYGGAVYIGSTSGVALVGNDIDDNRARATWGGQGGGIYAIDSPDLVLNNNDIHNNKAYPSQISEGGGAYIRDSDYAVLQDNRFYGNYVEIAQPSNITSLGGGGFYLNSDYVLVTGNEIYSNTVHGERSRGWPYGGGALIEYSNYLTFTYNVVHHNLAEGTINSHGDCGGLALEDVSNSFVAHNQIYANTATDRWGGVVLYGKRYVSNNIIFENNQVYDNEAQDGPAGGVYMDAIDSTFRNNQIHHNTSTDSGGGLVASGERYRLENNEIYANHSNAHGGGISLGGSDQTLIGNHIYSNTADSSAGGIVTTDKGHTFTNNRIYSNSGGYAGGVRVYHTSSATNPQVTFINNVIADNTATTGQGGGLSVSGENINLWHTTLARNSGPNAIYAYNGGTATFTHTLVYSHSVGAETESSDPAAITMTLTLWDAVPTQTVGAVNAFGNITGTAAFTADGYHLTVASDAIDQGVGASITDDIDGQLRPMGDAPDLGADEFPVSADLALHKTGPSSGTAGQMLTYTLTITNAATSEIMADARVVDTVEPASAVASLSGSTPGGDCTTAGAVITCDIYNIVTDTVRTLTVWVTPTATYDGILTNTATVTPTNALESAPADNAAGPVTTTVIYVPPATDLWVQKDAPAFVEPGAPLIYDLSWGNSGDATAMSVTLTDTLPGGVNFITATLTPDSTDPLVWHLGDLAPGATATATVRVVVGGALVDGTVLINTVEISSTTAEAITINNTDTATTTVYQLGGYDLDLQKASDPAEVEVGDTIGYGIRITNTGALPADVTLNDAIPAGTEYVPGSALAGSGTLEDSNGIEWQGTLDVDENVLVTFDVTVVACNGVECGTIRNVATAEIASVAYVWQEQVDTIVRCPDLSIAGAGPERSPQFSDDTFKRYDVVFTYANNNDHNNPGIAHNTTVTITLPDGAQFSASNPIANFTSPDKRTKVWNLGDLAAGANGTIQVQVEPYTWLDAGWTAHAEIYADPREECQPDQHPNQADVTTFPTKMELEKRAADPLCTVTRDPATGEVTQRVLVEYYLRYHYQTPDPARPPVSAYHIEDQWPGELTFERYTSAPELALIGDMLALHSEQAVTPLRFESTEYLYVGDPGWLRMQGATVTSVVTPGQVIVNEAEQTYETQKTQGTGTEVYTDSARVETQFVLVPPYITFPEEGKTCSGGSLEVRGTSWADITINIYLDGDLEPTTLVATTQTDGGGRFKTTVIIPTVSEFATHYLIARSEYDGEVSEASNRIALGKPSHGGWCPQRSYWEGTLKAGPNQGQDRTYYFRGQSGMRSTRNWQISGEYGFWNTQLHLYSCCTEATQAMTVTADGVVYTPSSRDGHWYHFNITGGAHNVTIESRCGDQVKKESGDILIDPDGYVFNVDKGGDYSGEGGMFSPVEAISGVTVTCMVSIPQWGGWVPWPAHLYEDQVNPQVTDDIYPDNITTTGYYAFFTPPGHYYIDVQGIEGYQEWRSPVVQVITEIVHVNVPYTPWPDQAAVTVTLTDEGIEPAVITIPVGSAVEWVSKLAASDTITDLIQWSENPILHPKSDLDPLENVQGFDAGFLEPGRVYRREFDWPGTYEYTDAAGHTGQVIVTGEPPYKYIYLPLVLKNYAP